MTQREKQILGLIEANPLIAQQDIARALGITRSAVAGHIMKMTAKGLIAGRAYVLGPQTFVAAIGGAAMDVHGRPIGSLERGDSNPGRVNTSAGGVARNIAENLCRLGIDCRLLTALGRDQHGEALLKLSRDAGIDMQFALQTDEHATPTYLSILDAHGDLDVAISDLSALRIVDVPYLQQHARMLERASALVLDTNLDTASLEFLCGHFAQIPIFVDPVSAAKATKIRPHLSAVHTITPSLTEAQEISGIAARGERRLSSIGRWFLDCGVKRVFITLGKRGVFFATKNGDGTMRAIEPTNDGNTNGAGDAFSAALVAAWLRRWPLPKATTFALAAARHTLSDTATVSPGLNTERLLELAEHHNAA